MTARIERDRSGAPDAAAVLAATGAAADVLAVPRVGREDSFFSLGCDSVRALQLAEALSERLGAPVTVGSLYESPTVRALAATIAA